MRPLAGRRGIETRRALIGPTLTSCKIHTRAGFYLTVCLTRRHINGPQKALNYLLLHAITLKSRSVRLLEGGRVEGKEGEREGGSFSAFPPLLVSHRSSFLPPPTPQTHPAVIFLADEAEPNVYGGARWGGDGGGSDVTAIPLSVSAAELDSPQPALLSARLPSTGGTLACWRRACRRGKAHEISPRSRNQEKL